jgi:hypothetical protein
MSYCYGSARLTYISVAACIAFELVCTTGVVVSRFCVSCWYIVLVDRKAIFRLVHFKRLVTLYMEGLWYVKVVHSLLLFSFVCVRVVQSFLAVSLFLKLCIRCTGKPLFWAIVIIVSHSCSPARSVMGMVNVLLM